MTLLERKEPMTVAEFFAFTDGRPDEERWELIDGEPVLNPSPAWNHQRVVRNLLSILTRIEEAGTAWEVLPGLGVILSNTRVPVPDVLIRPASRISGPACDDMLAAFEVLSPSSKSRDLRWKREAYSSLPSLQHYVVLAPDAVDVRCFSRAEGWAERRTRAQGDVVQLAAVAVQLRVADLYRGL